MILQDVITFNGSYFIVHGLSLVWVGTCNSRSGGNLVVVSNVGLVLSWLLICGLYTI